MPWGVLIANSEKIMNSTYSPVNIRERRVALKRQRQLRIIQSVWRSLLVSSLAGGLIWASLLPKWTIRQPQQIEIQGNQYLSATALRQILTEASSSQSVVTLPPAKMQSLLQNQAPIAQVRVARDLYPSRVTIAVTERKPVAWTVPNPTAINPRGKGYLDATGIWMSEENYRSSEAFPTPSLKVIGYQPQYRFQWAQIYPQLQALPLEIEAVNWQDPANLILETELGEVHLGGNIETLPRQLKILTQLQNLPQKLPPEQMRYINLKNPNFILVEVVSDVNKN